MDNYNVNGVFLWFGYERPSKTQTQSQPPSPITHGDPDLSHFNCLCTCQILTTQIRAYQIVTQMDNLELSMISEKQQWQSHQLQESELYVF